MKIEVSQEVNNNNSGSIANTEIQIDISRTTSEK